MNDPYELQRFIEAQNPVYDRVCAELKQGCKASHWMWFIFPQLQGLGQSAMAKKYAIASADEARAYLEHPILGDRLRECTELVNGVEGRSLSEIFGYPDDMKFRSCMALFASVAADEGVFAEALRKYPE